MQYDLEVFSDVAHRQQNAAVYSASRAQSVAAEHRRRSAPVHRAYADAADGLRVGAEQRKCTRCRNHTHGLPPERETIPAVRKPLPSDAAIPRRQFARKNIPLHAAILPECTRGRRNQNGEYPESGDHERDGRALQVKSRSGCRFDIKKRINRRQKAAHRKCERKECRHFNAITCEAPAARRHKGDRHAAQELDGICRPYGQFQQRKDHRERPTHCRSEQQTPWADAHARTPDGKIQKQSVRQRVSDKSILPVDDHASLRFATFIINSYGRRSV